jgi:hypothetical protein
MINNLSAYSFNNPTNLCDLGVCFDVASGALTIGILDPQTGQTRDGGYSPPPISITYVPVEIDGEDSIVLDNYLSEGSTVSVNLSSTTTCVNLATGYDAFNFGYQLLIEEKGQVLDRVDTFNYNNTFNIVCSASLISNWTVLSSTARYEKMLSGTSVDLLPVGSYKNSNWPYDVLTLNYYLPIEYEIPPVFWPNELLNIYKTKKIVWDMFSIRLGGEDLKNQYIPLKRAETSYIVAEARKPSNNILSFDTYGKTSLSSTLFTGQQIGSTITGLTGLFGQRDGLGHSVDINDAGDRVVVGSPYADNDFFDAFTLNTGKVQVYQFNGASWVQLGQNLVGVSINDYFGWCVSMNSSGSRIAVGYYGGGGSSDRGETKIYEWSGTQWDQIGQTISGLNVDDWSGWSIQLNSAGNRIAIGERLSDGGGSDSGGVRVFEYDGSLWVQMGSTINGKAASDELNTVSINAAGDVIVYGAVGADVPGTTNAGVVRAYNWDGTTWNQIGQDIYGGGDNTFALGISLSLNSNGDIFAVGMYSAEGGRVYVYKYNGSQWENLGQPLINDNSYITYGLAISLNGKGDRLAIGQPQYLYVAPFIPAVGQVFVYTYNDFYWEKTINNIVGEYQISGQSTRFGWSLSLNDGGDKLIVGADLIRGGEAKIYQLPSLSTLPYPVYSSLLWSDGTITQSEYDYPFYLPDNTIGYSIGGSILSRTFNVSGEYTLISNTRTYNISGFIYQEEEPYNITFVVS